MKTISKEVEDVAWNNNQKITAQQIVDYVTKQLKDKYKERDR